MLTGDALLRHYRKGMYHVGIGSYTLLSLMYSWYLLLCVYAKEAGYRDSETLLGVKGLGPGPARCDLSMPTP